MQLLKSKKLMLLLITLVSIFAFGATTSLAQEKVKIKTKFYGVFTTFEQMKPDDTEGHTLSLYEAKGAGAGASGDVTFLADGQSDLVKGNGPHHGYTKINDKDGHFYFTKWQGEVTTTKSPEGKPIMKFGGTWSITKGTGKWENAQGDGTYKGWFIGKGIYTYISEGEYFIKK
jgi:hypothetical protein